MRVPLKSNVTYKATYELKNLIPKGKTVSSFFLYDGHLEASLARAERSVVAHTNRPSVYEFWFHLLKDPQTLAYTAEGILPAIANTYFPVLQESWTQYDDPALRSAFFFILNRCSDDGRISFGIPHKSRLNPAAFALLKAFEIETLYPTYDRESDVIETIRNVKDSDYVLLPAGRYSLNLFEHGKIRTPESTPIHHRRLHQVVEDIGRPTIVLYKKHPALFKLYKDYNIHMIDAYGRPTSATERCEEMIIANF